MNFGSQSLGRVTAHGEQNAVDRPRPKRSRSRRRGGASPSPHARQVTFWALTLLTGMTVVSGAVLLADTVAARMFS
jgi:hypothetical protein